MRKILFSFLILNLFFCKLVLSETNNNILPVGILLPLTGDSAPGQGQYAKQGIELAHLESKDKLFKLIFEDSQCSGKSVISAAHKLVEINKVSMIIGDVCWTHLISPITEKRKVIVIAPGSAQSSVREAGDYIFRLKLDVSIDSREFASILRKRLKIKKIAILYVKDEWGEGIANNFSDEFKKNDGKIVYEEGFTQSERDFKAFLLKLKNLKPDLIMIGAFPVQVALIARQAKQLNINIPLAAYGGSVDQETIELGGKALDGMLVLQEYVLDKKNSEMQIFHSKFKNHFNRIPNLFAALGYDAYKLLESASQKCKRDTNCIRDILYSTKKYKGASGVITIDEKGDVIKNSYLRVIKNSKFIDYIN